MAEFSDFEKLDIRVGTILQVEDFQNARNPAYKLIIDFGPIGKRNSSAQITSLYRKEELINKQIIAIVNFPPKKIADFISEVLVLGVYGNQNEVVLLQTERKIDNGSKIG